MTRDEMIETLARAIALHFTSNRQPDMSGDVFAKLRPHEKRSAFEAAQSALCALEASNLRIVPAEASKEG